MILIYSKNYCYIKKTNILVFLFALQNSPMPPSNELLCYVTLLVIPSS